MLNLMGCICSKGINKQEIVSEVASLKKESIKSLPRIATSSKKDDAILVKDVGTNPTAGNAAALRSLSKGSRHHQRSITVDVRANNGENEGLGKGRKKGLGIGDVPNGFSGEHVIAGWPPWLTAVAAEAIKGWLPRRADSFEKLHKIGQGTYSSVYKARDLEAGKIVALKKVRFVNMDPESVRFMAREIHILRRLEHPNVIKLEGIVTSRMSCSLYLVFEYMEHDLAGLLAMPSNKFTEPQAKCFMQQLLSGLHHCHSHGVLHRDIKGSNLLVDSNGILRIGDFGLATVFNPEQRQPLTSRVVTLWYRPPELLLGATEYGVAVDLWSAGCILAELFAGKPIMPGRTEVEQLHKIFKLCGSPEEDYWKKSKLTESTIFRPQHPYPRRVAETFRDFPSSALKLLDSLLAIEPEERGTASSALQSEFFTTKPLACDPSSLPKYPTSKEYDAKLRDEEARRKREATVKGRETDAGRRGTRESQAKTVQDNSTEAQEKQCSSKGFPIEPCTGDHSYPRAGSAMHPGAYGNSRIKKKRDDEHRRVPGSPVSTLQTSIGPQLTTERSYLPQYGGTGDISGFSRSNTTSRYNRFDVVEPSEKQYVLDKPGSGHKKDDVGSKDSVMGYGNKNRRIHYSGPLVPAGGNVEDMLKEHERQIQQAVRKARINQNKTNTNF